MKTMCRHVWPALAMCLAIAIWLSPTNGQSVRVRRNAIIFVADGLRPGSINPQDMPTLSSIRQRGVNFTNSHSLFPTFTMANASAIATGHTLGDTGVFGNYLWTGRAVYSGTPVPFLENDQVLNDINTRLSIRLPAEITLLAAAAEQGYNTASIGKVGSSGLLNMGASVPLVIDESTGSVQGFPLSSEVIDEMKKAGLSVDAPNRSNGYGPTSQWNNGYAGSARQPGTKQANIVQQQWFAVVATRVVLPIFKRRLPKPFLLAYWSRDPDGTQHNQGDSPGALSPGINGATSRLAVQNADRNLRQILEWLDANPDVKANTDVFVTSDHGFATISKREIAPGVVTASEVARHNYVDTAGEIDTEQGTLPYGFLAIELALGLQTNLFDPDRRPPAGTVGPFRQVRIGPDTFEHPLTGHGLLGNGIRKEDGSDAMAIVAANGGSDLIYVPDKNTATVERIMKLLTRLDYVGGIFVDDVYGPMPGALPLSAIGFAGSSSAMPRPAIVVAFKHFYLTPGNLQTAVQVSDATQQHGQGMHGGIGRDSTLNTMAAIGIDFKAGYIDPLPVSNADIAPTIAQLLRIKMPSTGMLRGRVLVEALRGNASAGSAASKHLESEPAGDRRTILHFQEFGGVRYIDRACFVAAVICGN